MKLIHQAVVNGFMLYIPDQFHPDRAQFFKSAVDGVLFHMGFGGGSVDIFWGYTEAADSQ